MSTQFTKTKQPCRYFLLILLQCEWAWIKMAGSLPHGPERKWQHTHSFLFDFIISNFGWCPCIHRFLFVILFTSINFSFRGTLRYIFKRLLCLVLLFLSKWNKGEAWKQLNLTGRRNYQSWEAKSSFVKGKFLEEIEEI